MRIPNWLNALIVASGLLAAWARLPMIDALIGAGAGYGALLLLNGAYRAARGRGGLGLGDAKLLAGAGAWLGWMGLPFVVLIASACGIVFVAALRIFGRELTAHDALPFGPFLCAGAMVVWLAQRFSG